MERDEHIYAYVMQELENGIKDEAFWIKAYSISEGIKEKIKPLYIQYRVNFIKEKYNALSIDYSVLKIENINNFVMNDFQDDSWIEKLWEWADEDYIEDLGYCNYSGYSKDEYVGIPKNKDELLTLTHLHLKCKDCLEKLPKEIGNLTSLTNLRITNGSYLIELPKEIGNLSNLTNLAIEDCILLNDFPEEITKLCNLTYIEIINTNFIKLPRVLYNLTNLTMLCIKDNHLLKKLSMAIRKLTNLRELVIWNNKALLELPKEIGNLENLAILILRDCYIETIPKEIGSLNNLKNLYFTNTIFTDIPDELCNLTNLVSLKIYNEHLILTKEQKEWIQTIKKTDIEIPSYRSSSSHSEDWKNQLEGWACMQLRNLDRGDYCDFEFNVTRKLESKIDISYNETIMKIPDELKYLNNLQIFNIHGTKSRRIPLSEIPKEISVHRNLKELSVTNFFLTELPKEIGNLLNLEYLNLSNNNLTKLPEEMGNLLNLKRLNLSDNKLTKLPEEIVHLTNLTEISVVRNPTLVLTQKQKEWIEKIINNKESFWMYKKIDDDLFDRK